MAEQTTRTSPRPLMQIGVDSFAVDQPERCVGDPKMVAEKILHVNESLGGISCLTFQMSVAALPHAKLMRAIELLGTRVAPLVRSALASKRAEALLSTNSRRAA